jgi:putative phage-type endonuclease
VKTATIQRESFDTRSTEEWLKLRSRDITSTESAALFGLSPYLTKFELWHRKRDRNIVEMEPNERMKWGTRLQDSIAAGIAADQKWMIDKRTQYERLPDLRLGASFDFTILNGDGGAGLLEVKNVDSLAARDGWIEEDEELEAPPHIELQVQHQLLVSGLPYAVIGALVGGNRTVLIRREPAPSVIQSIVTKAEDFWKSVEAGIAPAPNFAKDSEFITKLYQSVRQGKVVDVSKDEEVLHWVKQYETASAAMKEAETTRQEMKARIFTKLGDAEKATTKEFSISLGSVKPTRVEAFDRAGFKMFRVNKKSQ